MRESYKRYQAATTAWPAHIYNYYSITAIVEKARTQLAQHKIDTMPTDPTQLSFWLVRNLHLSDSLMKTIFLTDSVNMRMKLISNTFTDVGCIDLTIFFIFNYIYFLTFLYRIRCLVVDIVAIALRIVNNSSQCPSMACKHNTAIRV